MQGDLISIEWRMAGNRSSQEGHLQSLLPSTSSHHETHLKHWKKAGAFGDVAILRCLFPKLDTSEYGDHMHSVVSQTNRQKPPTFHMRQVMFGIDLQTYEDVP